jgi:DNA-binding HxlR family transcriptional regulator
MEKFSTPLLIALFGIVGYFLRDLLSDIKTTQKEHGTALSTLRTHIGRIEERQTTQNSILIELQRGVTATAEIQRETKSILDHNLYELRQQIKEQADEQFVQKQNFGKIIVIVQKLYAATKNGSSK